MANLRKQLLPWRHLLPLRPLPTGATDSGYVFYLHRSSQEMSVMAAVLVVAAIEGPLVHLLLASWSHTAAWIVTALTVLMVAWVLGFARAGRKIPTRVEGEVLHLADGLYEELTVMRKDISAWSLEILGSNAARGSPTAEPAVGADTGPGQGQRVTRFKLSFGAPVTLSRFAGEPESVTEYHFDVTSEGAVAWLEGWLASGSDWPAASAR